MNAETAETQALAKPLQMLAASRAEAAGAINPVADTAAAQGRRHAARQRGFHTCERRTQGRGLRAATGSRTRVCGRGSRAGCSAAGTNRRRAGRRTGGGCRGSGEPSGGRAAPGTRCFRFTSSTTMNFVYRASRGGAMPKKPSSAPSGRSTRVSCAASSGGGPVEVVEHVPAQDPVDRASSCGKRCLKNSGRSSSLLSRTWRSRSAKMSSTKILQPSCSPKS